jgi:uncharacterized protein
VVAAPVNRLELVREFRSTLERVGGQDAWVEPLAERYPGRLPSAHDAFRVWLTPAIYTTVIEAADDKAKKEHLLLRTESSATTTLLRNERIELARESVLLFSFQLREVPRMARVAIIVDDLGHNLEAAEALSEIHSAITFSIIPHLRYSRETAGVAHRAGHEVMLHLPMQPIMDSAPDVSPDELRVGMGRAEIWKIMDSDLNSLPFVTGVNNHMGSRATADAGLMQDVMRVLAARHLYFVDSLTTNHSVALRVARQFNVSSFYRSVFLDDTRSVSYTRGQLQTLCRIAERKGVALAIGHPYPTTIVALTRFLPQLEQQGIRLVPASQLVR